VRRILIGAAAATLIALPLAILLLRAPMIEAKRLPRRNPTSYVFKVSDQEAHQGVVRALGHYDWRRMGLDDWSAEDRTFHLRNFHDPIGKSPVYFAKGEPLDFLAEFRIDIVRRGPLESEVSVSVLRPEVINGKQFGFGSCGPGFANRYVPVEPTSIEEYEILLKIGAALQEKGMPELILP